jgi:hypothetical protein
MRRAVGRERKCMVDFAAPGQHPCPRWIDAENNLTAIAPIRYDSGAAAAAHSLNARAAISAAIANYTYSAGNTRWSRWIRSDPEDTVQSVGRMQVTELRADLQNNCPIEIDILL